MLILDDFVRDEFLLMRLKTPYRLTVFCPYRAQIKFLSKLLEHVFSFKPTVNYS